MVALRKWMYIWIAVCIAGALTIVPPRTAHAQAAAEDETILIQEWQMRWEQPGEELTIEEVNAAEDGWFTVRADGEYPVVPSGILSVWMRVQLPSLDYRRPALLFNDLIARDVSIFLNNELIYERSRTYSYVYNKLLIPLSNDESNTYLYIQLKNYNEKLGPQQAIAIDDFYILFGKQIKDELFDVILGASLIFIALFMLLSVLFLNKPFLPGWNSLFVVMLSIGIMILSYSTLLETILSNFGFILYNLFDIASALLVPSIFIFFEKVIGKGPYQLITRFKWVQIVFSSVSLSMLVVSWIVDDFVDIYTVFGTMALGSAIVIGNIILICSLVYQCLKRDKDAIILAGGFSIFAGVSLGEVIWFFISDRLHIMFFWKISILFFIASLIIIVVRKSMSNYEQAVEYSKQIEIFNNELQRSEKIEMISHLAASIAHEVRNPLQVTRGFLQLLGQKTDGDREKSYMLLAIDELDRASEIITDFLTFAKPDLGEVLQLSIVEEIQQIKAILAPLAIMQGGAIVSNVQDGIYIRGNSSKFKQALINIIKNGIEAFKDDGLIEIDVYADEKNERVIVRVKDNGEGMSEEDLKRLGEPYYSKKSKGTGLGLMVTFRIIEAMHGSITFTSTKGVGTEALINLPKYKDSQ